MKNERYIYHVMTPIPSQFNPTEAIPLFLWRTNQWVYCYYNPTFNSIQVIPCFRILHQKYYNLNCISIMIFICIWTVNTNMILLFLQIQWLNFLYKSWDDVTCQGSINIFFINTIIYLVCGIIISGIVPWIFLVDGRNIGSVLWCHLGCPCQQQMVIDHSLFHTK